MALQFWRTRGTTAWVGGWQEKRGRGSRRKPKPLPTNRTIARWSPRPATLFTRWISKVGFTSLNPAALRLFEYSAEEMLGGDFTAFLTPESAEVARRHFQQGLLGTDNTPFFDVEARTKAGNIIHLEVRAGSLFQNGVRVGRQGIARDISELKALQAQVVEKSARVALLEERTRIAMNLYARIAGLAREDTGNGASPDAALRQVQDAVLRASADKVGLTAFDLRVLEFLSKGALQS